jgi:hypothetical protein
LRSVSFKPALLAILALAVTAGCTEPAAVEITIAASSVEVRQGESAAIAVTLVRDGDPVEAVLSAEGVPAGVSAVFTAPAAGATTYTLTLSATAIAAAGPATITVKAVAAGAPEATATFSLEVLVRGTYTLTTPSEVELIQLVDGRSLTVTIARLDGYTQDVSLRTTALPDGITAVFLPAVLSGGATTSVLTFTVAASAVPAAPPMTVIGSTPGLADVTKTLVLNVVEPLSLTFTTPDPAPVSISTTIELKPNYQCGPAVTVRANNRNVSAAARWIGMSTDMVTLTQGNSPYNADSAAAVGFWQTTTVQPGETHTKARHGFAAGGPFKVTMRFRYRIVPTGAIHLDSVVTHCGEGAPP